MTEIQKRSMAIQESLTEEINNYHAKCEEAVGQAVAYAVEAGERLLEVKDSLKHGGWLKWLDANFEGSRRHAQRYMQLAERKERLNAPGVSHSSIRGALGASQLQEAKEKAAEKTAKRAAEVSKAEYYESGDCWLPLEVMWQSPASWLESVAKGPSDSGRKKLRKAVREFTHAREAPPEVLAVEDAPEVLDLLKDAKKQAAGLILTAVEQAEELIMDAAWNVEVVSWGAPTEKFPVGNPPPERKKQLLEINEAQKQVWFARHPEGVCRCNRPGGWTRWGDNM
jgi:hypothetical protein